MAAQKGCGDLGELLEDELNVTVEVAEGGRRLKLSKAQISVRHRSKTKVPEGIFGHFWPQSTSCGKPAGCAMTSSGPQRCLRQ